MAKEHAKRLAKFFHLDLSPELVEWFDGAYESSEGAGEFDQVIDPALPMVWGGQMLPDSLPIIGNGFGDVVCLRFNADGSLREVILWRHEGGLWSPVDSTLSAALDAIRATASDKAPALSDIGTAQNWFLHEERCRRLIHRGLHQACHERGGQRLADAIGVPWFPTFHSWLFDYSQIPTDMRSQLSELLEDSAENLFEQDWVGAACEAEEVIRSRDDLAWPFAVQGWVAERNGDISRAVNSYSRGLTALGSTSTFTEDWAWRSGKFAVSRLAALKPNLSVAAASYLDASSKHGARKWWLAKASDAEKQGDMDLAYDCYYRAGWDDFFTNDMNQLLKDLVRVSTAAKQPARAAIARFHLQSCG